MNIRTAAFPSHSKLPPRNAEPKMIEKTILIADDDDDLCQALALRCRRLGLNTVVANDGIRALQLAETLVPDLICLDVNMPAGNGFAVCEMLSDIHSIDSSSIAILTGRKDLETIERCQNLGATYIHKGRSAWNELENLICYTLFPMSASNWTRLEQHDCVFGKLESSTNASVVGGLQAGTIAAQRAVKHILDRILTMLEVAKHHLESTTTVALEKRQSHFDFNSSFHAAETLKQPWILHVDDDCDLSDALKIRLEVYGVSVIQACTGRSGITQAFAKPVSAIILDLDMPNGDGRYVLEHLKACEATKHIPVIILTGHREEDRKQELLSLGAACYLVKPTPFDTLFAKLLPHLGLPTSEACYDH